MTQALDDTGGGSGDDEDFMEKVVARVKLVGAPGTTFDVKGGDTNIGRDPERCPIHIQSKSLSRVHAVIEVSRDGHVMIYDNNSMNCTYKNGHKLKPEVHYALEGGETLKFGDVEAIFSTVTVSDHSTNADDEQVRPLAQFFPVLIGEITVLFYSFQQLSRNSLGPLKGLLS